MLDVDVWTGWQWCLRGGDQERESSVPGVYRMKTNGAQTQPRLLLSCETPDNKKPWGLERWLQTLGNIRYSFKAGANLLKILLQGSCLRGVCRTDLWSVRLTGEGIGRLESRKLGCCICPGWGTRIRNLGWLVNVITWIEERKTRYETYRLWQREDKDKVFLGGRCQGRRKTELFVMGKSSVIM